MAAEQRAQKLIEEEQKVKAGIERTRNTILLDLLMPNGKQLRHCTGRDRIKVHGQFKAIDRLWKKLKPNQMFGSVYSEADVQAVVFGLGAQ